MAATKIQAVLSGKIQPQELAKLADQLRKVERKMALRITAKAGRRAASVILKEVRRRAPKEIGVDSLSRARAGLYRRALAVKVKTYGDRGYMIAVIGVRRRLKWRVGARKSGGTVYHAPSKLSHLLEYGTETAAARPHLRPGFAASKDRAVAEFARTVREDLERIEHA